MCSKESKDSGKMVVNPYVWYRLETPNGPLFESFLEILQIFEPNTPSIPSMITIDPKNYRCYIACRSSCVDKSLGVPYVGAVGIACYLSKCRVLHIEDFALNPTIHGMGLAKALYTSWRDYIYYEWPETQPAGRTAATIEVYPPNVPKWRVIMKVEEIKVSKPANFIRDDTPIIPMARDLPCSPDVAYDEWQEYQNYLYSALIKEYVSMTNDSDNKKPIKFIWRLMSYLSQSSSSSSSSSISSIISSSSSSTTTSSTTTSPIISLSSTPSSFTTNSPITSSTTTSPSTPSSSTINLSSSSSISSSLPVLSSNYNSKDKSSMVGGCNSGSSNLVPLEYKVNPTSCPPNDIKASPENFKSVHARLSEYNSGHAKLSEYKSGHAKLSEYNSGHARPSEYKSGPQKIIRIKPLSGKRTAIVYHRLFEWYNSGYNYSGQFRASVLKSKGEFIEAGQHFDAGSTARAFSLVEASDLIDDLHYIKASPATKEQISCVHTREYIEKIENLNATGGEAGEFTTFGPGGYDIACLAAGACIQAADAVINGLVNNAYAVVRPCGHHARKSGKGFCVLNNMGITVEYIKKTYKFKRIVIVDIDAHHGNGTQEIYYRDNEVLYISTHQISLYPRRSGSVNETGEGKGIGYTINIPLPPGTGEGGYDEAWKRIVIPAIDNFCPDIILVSIGYNTLAMDPMSIMMLSSYAIVKQIRHLVALAERHCSGRLVLIHEGGYSPATMPYAFVAVIQELMRNTDKGRSKTNSCADIKSCDQRSDAVSNPDGEKSLIPTKSCLDIYRQSEHSSGLTRELEVNSDSKVLIIDPYREEIQGYSGHNCTMEQRALIDAVIDRHLLVAEKPLLNPIDRVTRKILDDNIHNIISYCTSLIGKPYASWKGGIYTEKNIDSKLCSTTTLGPKLCATTTLGPKLYSTTTLGPKLYSTTILGPLWSCDGIPPDVGNIDVVNCSGLINLGLRSIGLPLPVARNGTKGGTLAYQEYYEKVAEPFDNKQIYPIGTLIGRRYKRYGRKDQKTRDKDQEVVDRGHVAIIIADNYVLQSCRHDSFNGIDSDLAKQIGHCPDPAKQIGHCLDGVNNIYTLQQANEWNDGDYYHYAVLPENWLLKCSVGSGSRPIISKL